MPPAQEIISIDSPCSCSIGNNERDDAPSCRIVLGLFVELVLCLGENASNWGNRLASSLERHHFDFKAPGLVIAILVSSLKFRGFRAQAAGKLALIGCSKTGPWPRFGIVYPKSENSTKLFC